MSKQRKASKKSPKKADSPEKNGKENEDENKYGGLPQRDLKKNLGCGG